MTIYSHRHVVPSEARDFTYEARSKLWTENVLFPYVRSLASLGMTEEKNRRSSR
jgi:hypothetical protein